jgi:hypothetical protein
MKCPIVRMGSSGEFSAGADFGGILQSLRRLERVSVRSGFAKMRAWPVWRKGHKGAAGPSHRIAGAYFRPGP